MATRSSSARIASSGSTRCVTQDALGSHLRRSAHFLEFGEDAQAGWDVQRDHAELLIDVSRLSDPWGAAVFSCNLRGFTLDAEAIERAGVQVVDITDKTIPTDFERNAKGTSLFCFAENLAHAIICCVIH